MCVVHIFSLVIEPLAGVSNSLVQPNLVSWYPDKLKKERWEYRNEIVQDKIEQERDTDVTVTNGRE